LSLRRLSAGNVQPQPAIALSVTRRFVVAFDLVRIAASIESTREHDLGQRTMADHTSSAVVLGASMGGLLAARALSGTFQRVTIVERDPARPLRAVDALP
jgi:heterodisulfide reductase subunit A-like polyferredoxin